MAFTTENEYTGNGSTTKYSFSFPYVISSDIKATIEDVNGNPIDTQFTLIDPTTVEFTTPPASGRKVRIFRQTNVDNVQTQFFPGAAIRADDLNLNALQVLYAAQEVQERAVTTDGGVIEGDTVFVNADLVFEGSTDDDKETRLSVVDPTADQTYRLPNISTGGTHNLISDGDTGTVTSGMLETNIAINGSLNGNASTATDLAAAAKVDLSEHTAHVVNDTSYFTTNASDARYFRQDSSETIASGDTWTGSDAFVATTGAIDNRIIDLVDDVGGFVPIANETSFPASNPDINSPATGGTIVSIKEISTSLVPTGGSVTIANGRGTGLPVTINGLGTTTLAQGFGALLETTVTDHIYTFHRLTPKATEVTTVANATPALTTVANDIANVNTTAGDIANVNTVANDIANVNTTAGSIGNVNVVGTNISSVNAFSERYRLPQATTNEYTTSLDVGDLYFNTTQNELRIFNGTSWQAGVTAGNNFMALSGANAMNGPLQLENASDTELLPSLIFEGDPNTGLFQDQADTVSITTGGTERFKVEDTGITVGTWNASTIATGKGGTGQTTYSNGELLIGNASGGLTKATLTATAPVTVTNDDGSITIDVTNATTSADGLFSSTDKTKLDAIEASADVTDATNVAAAGAVMEGDATTANMSFVVDEDDMTSNTNTKVPTQQSVKAYVDGTTTANPLYVAAAGDTMSGDLAMGTNKVTGLGTPSATGDAATKGYVDTQITNLVDSSPAALDTLNELAAALGDDANFSTTVTASIATKLPLAGGQMTGNLTFSGNQTVDGRDLSVDGAKLDNIENNATADQSATEILTAIKTVDGSGSGLDADTVDGLEATKFVRTDQASTITTGNLTLSSGDIFVNNGTNNSVLIQAGDGSIEISRGAGGAYIDFKNVITEDHDVRLQESSGNLLIAGSRILTVADEGSGNGIDADSCDGQHLGTTANVQFANLTATGTVNFDISLLTAI